MYGKAKPDRRRVLPSSRFLLQRNDSLQDPDSAGTLPYRLIKDGQIGTRSVLHVNDCVLQPGSRVIERFHQRILIRGFQAEEHAHDLGGFYGIQPPKVPALVHGLLDSQVVFRRILHMPGDDFGTKCHRSTPFHSNDLKYEYANGGMMVPPRGKFREKSHNSSANPIDLGGFASDKPGFVGFPQFLLQNFSHRVTGQVIHQHGVARRLVVGQPL
jgi:hypothetical protein